MPKAIKPATQRGERLPRARARHSPIAPMRSGVPSSPSTTSETPWKAPGTSADVVSASSNASTPRNTSSPMVRLRKKSIQRRSILRTNGSHSRPMKTGITPAYTPSSAKVPR